MSEPKKKMEMKALNLVARAKRLHEKLIQLKNESTNISVTQLLELYLDEIDEHKLFLPKVKQYFNSIQHSLIPNNHVAVTEIYYYESLLDEIEVWINTLEK